MLNPTVTAPLVLTTPSSTPRGEVEQRSTLSVWRSTCLTLLDEIS